MTVPPEIRPGLAGEVSLKVTPEHVPGHLRDTSLQVLATPLLVGLMEEAAHRTLRPHLLEGFTSVGTWLEVRHLAPTPVGWEVTVRAVVTEVDGYRVLFEVEAFDGLEKVGQGRHERVIVEEARLRRRLEAKRGS